MITEWCGVNQRNPRARSLTYYEFPSECSWDNNARSWEDRKRGRKIGHLCYVHPSSDELYYLRILIMIVRGTICYTDVRSYNNTIFDTFKQACAARGLLGDDNEWYHALDEALCYASGPQLMQLFITILIFYNVKYENRLFAKYWNDLADDLQYHTRLALQNPNYVVPVMILQNRLLEELEIVFNKNGASINAYGLPNKTSTTERVLENKLIQEELSYDVDQLQHEVPSLFARLNADQRSTYMSIVSCVLIGLPGFFFVSGYGGTGKLFFGIQLLLF